MAEVKQTRIFLSYARKDIGLVNDLYNRLQQAGFSPWQDSKDIYPGEVWKDALIRAIHEAPFFLACLSNNSVNKRGVIQEEIKEALQMWRQKLDDDIYFIPVRLEECQVPEALAKFQWVDLFEEGGFSKLTQALRRGLDQLGYIAPLRLRSQPVNPLYDEAVNEMLKERDFYHKSRNWMGRGVHHLYEPKDQLVIDHTTGLMWQQAGSDRGDFPKAQEYIRQLNRDKFAGYSDWRLPSLEEAMSLMEAKQNEVNGLYINSLFDKRQSWIWTADMRSASVAWVVGFSVGYCDVVDLGVGGHYVRGVRSGQSS